MTSSTPATSATVGARISPELTPDSLLDLSTREIAAIHVEDFYPKGMARRVVKSAMTHEALGTYRKELASSVGRIHTPHVDTAWDPELTDAYHRQAVHAVHDVRSMFHPYLSPIDHLRLLLQELWPAGANLLRLNGRTCFVGALRVFTPGASQLLPHNDRLHQETDAPEARHLTEQITANVYLQVPETGGDLHLWLREPDQAETERILAVEGLDPGTIEPPALTIHPRAGDLIMFSSSMLHAVSPSPTEPRVGMAAFIGSRGANYPLVFWS
ncbi:2OG-Fe(II) oxygenase [Streptomyces sp. NPDC087228]|uniref:2OG-Fe(II)-dependent halogenase WelO5 family protein n=1 Tax=Streptomyces sp. NPDC087228 TaxID=3365772 RepID=UPI00382E528B